MNVAARNSPCPCGSGRRYKECHGALSASAKPDAAPLQGAPAQPQLALLMHEALTLQREGRIADAITKYEAVIADEPENYDALHMLGVAWFQSTHFDRAEEYVRRALAIRPAIVAAKTNLALINEGRRLAAMETELCRQVLPKMSPLCRASPFDGTLRDVAALDLVVALRALDNSDQTAMQRIVDGRCDHVVVWRIPFTTVEGGREDTMKIRDLHAGFEPTSDFILVYGLDLPTAYWMPARRPTHVALIVNCDRPCQVLDRIRELSDEGRSPIGLIFTDVNVMSSLKLPGLLLDEFLHGASH
jgi:hypothetical protein